MIRLLKYLKGYLRIRVWGCSPERFMNLCSNKNILIWDIVPDGDIYYMSISLKSFYRLKEITRKTGTRVVICKRYGLPFLLPVLWSKKIFLLGLVMAVAFWIWSSFYIWDMQVAGNYLITEDQFFAFLQKEQVHVGMQKKELDIKELEKAIRREFTQITWTSVKLTGTRLIIDVKENDAPIITEAEKENTGMDLVSEYAGTVISMVVRKGVPKVRIGDSVEKETVLVEGKVPVYQEDGTIREYQYVNADADIILEHLLTFRDTLPFDYIQKNYTGRRKQRYFLRFGEKEWRRPEEHPFLVYDSVVKTNRPALLETLSVPLYWGVYTYREYQNVEHEYTLAQAKELLDRKTETFLLTLTEKGVQIIEKDVKIDTSGGVWVVAGSFLVQETVGKKIPTAITDQILE